MHGPTYLTILATLSFAMWHPTNRDCCAQQEATLRILNDIAAKNESAHNAFDRKEFEIAAQIFGEIANRESEATFEDEQGIATEARYWLAEAHMHRRAYRQARKHYARYLKSSPSGQYAAWASLRLGQTAKRLGEYAAAERALYTFLKRFSGHEQAETAYRELPDVLYRLALKDFRAWKDYGDREGIDSAYKRFETHIRVFPNDKNHEQVCYHLGHVFLEKKNYEQAKHIFSRCIASASKNATNSKNGISKSSAELLPFAHYYLADVLKQLGDEKAAQKHFQTIIDAWPNGSVAKPAAQQLAKIRAASTDIAPAKPDAAKPDSPQIHPESREPKQLVHAVAKIESQKTVVQPIASGDTHQTIDHLIHAASSHFRQNDVDKAILTLIRAEKSFPASVREHEIHDLFGHCHAAKGHYESARRSWQRVARSTYAPPNLAANALTRIAQSYRDQGNYHAAIREYLRLSSVFENDRQYRCFALDSAASCFEQIGDYQSAMRIAAAQSSMKSPSDLTAQTLPWPQTLVR